MIACARSKNGFNEENEIQCNNYKCFKLLLSLDDNKHDNRLIVNRRYCSGERVSSVMMSCITLKKIECVKLLIDYCRKYKINFKNDCLSPNTNALALAMSKNEKMVQLLFKNMDLFDLNQRGYLGGVFTYPLHPSIPFDDYFTMESDYKKCLDVVFDEMSKDSDNQEQSFNPTVLDMGGMGIFERFVTKESRIEFFDYFIQQARDKCGWNIKQLIENYRNSNNDTLFHVAVRQSSLTYLEYLLKLNVLDDINIIGGRNDDTLLNECIASKARYDEVTYKSSVNFKVFEFLLSHDGINPNISNKFGYNAFDMCRRCQKFEYLDILNEWNTRQ